MRVEPLTPAIAPAWDAFVLAHPAGWFWHTTGWLRYGLALGGDREDLSFAVLDGDQIVAVCPLLREGGRIAFEGEPGAWPLVDSSRAGWASATTPWATLSSEIKRCGPAWFRSCPLAAPPPCDGSLAEAIGWQSRVIDLTQDVKALHAGLRRSYKALINFGMRGFDLAVGSDLASAYSNVHKQALSSRPDETYRMQADWARVGLAFLVGAMQRSRWVAFAYVFTYKGMAYYGSGPSLERGAMHAVLWHAILEAKARGCSRIELGWQGHARDAKGRGVERFKAGFGGEDVPIWVVLASKELL